MKFLENDNSVSINLQNLQVLTTEMCKISKDLSSALLRDVFKSRSGQTYHLRQRSQFFYTKSEVCLLWN